MADQDPPAPPAGGGETATVEKAPPKAKSKPAVQPRKDTKTDRLPPYNVVLLDDDHHTYAYVIEMLGVLFGFDPVKAFKLAEEVDLRGRVILLTTHKEKAELKRDQITAYGADVRMASSQGSMSALIEPAQG
jgi:ATP-dependent Clp protease adaptor protein ClpS